MDMNKREGTRVLIHNPWYQGGYTLPYIVINWTRRILGILTIYGGPDGVFYRIGRKGRLRRWRI